MDSAFARLSALNCALAGKTRQDGTPFNDADFMRYANDASPEAEENDPTVEETVAGFMAILGAKKNG